MKFSLFVHMERIHEQDTYKALYQDFIDLCIMADKAEMECIWTGEHHGMDFTIAPNPFINLVDIARQTKQIKVGTGTIIAPFWHPIKLAGEAAMTDLITDGRLQLGIARGAYNYEYERISPGLDAWAAGQKMREIVPTIRKLWQGDYLHEGEFYQFPMSSVAPKPLQKDGPPIWLAARDPSTHEFAIENNCHVQVTPLWQGMDEVKSLIQRFKDSIAKVKLQKELNYQPKIMLLQHAYVADSNHNTKNEIANACQKISEFYAHFGAWFKNEAPVFQGRIEKPTKEMMQKMTLYSPETVQQNMPIGTADQVIEKLKIYESLGYDEFSLWIDSGMDIEDKKASLQRFITQVMPYFNEQ